MYVLCIYIYIKLFGKNTQSQMMGNCREIVGKFRIRHGVPRLRIYIYVYYTYHMYYICIYYHVFLESPAIEYITIHYGSWWVPYQKLICFCWMVTGKLLVFIFRNTVWLWVVMGGYRYGGGYTGQLLLVKKTHIPQFRV